MTSNTINLTGKTALVTGASRGIGRAICEVLMECGADVLGIGTSIKARDGGLTDHAVRCGTSFTPIDADLSDRSQINSLLEGFRRDHVEVDILVNNAGIIRRSPAESHSLEDWDRVLAVNLDAVFQLSQAFGQQMIERGDGKIINIASVLSFQGGILVPGYAASKGAIAQLTKALANEWACKGVNVNAVAPGYIATDNTADLQKDADRTASLMARIPVARWGEPREIAWPVAFLASAQASFIHGTVLPVDGGWLAR